MYSLKNPNPVIIGRSKDIGKVEFLLSRREHQPSLGAALLPICESLSSGLIKSDDHTKIFCA